MTVFEKVQSAVDEIVSVDSIGLTKDEAQKLVSELIRLHGFVEDTLAEVAVEHQIYVELGDYGNGRHVALEDIDYGWGAEYTAGQWVSSSSTC
jgi:polyhydroxyalkanoate synthesis regulator phasin